MVQLSHKHIKKISLLIEKETISKSKALKELLKSDKFKDFKTEIEILDTGLSILLMGDFLGSKSYLDASQIKNGTEIIGILKFDEVKKLHSSIIINIEIMENLKNSTENKTSLKDDSWKSLFGAWSDTNDNLAEEIRNSRLDNRDVPSFD